MKTPHLKGVDLESSTTTTFIEDLTTNTLRLISFNSDELISELDELNEEENNFFNKHNKSHSENDDDDFTDTDTDDTDTDTENTVYENSRCHKRSKQKIPLDFSIDYERLDSLSKILAAETTSHIDESLNGENQNNLHKNYESIWEADSLNLNDSSSEFDHKLMKMIITQIYTLNHLGL